jgi:glycosyltransferase involved in cell wall biosynthesis
MLEGAKVAVVVPAFNEARLIARTVRSIPAYVDRVLVVDDASEDGTIESLSDSDDPRLAIVRHAKNRGAGAAIATGYERVFAEGADVAAVMAADGQMDPRDLESVLLPVVRGEADYAKGDRLSHPEAFERMPALRWIGNHALSSMTRVATGLDVRDSQCGYTALSRTAWRELRLDALWPRYGYPNDLLSRLAVAGLRVREVVVLPVYGDEESGIRPSDLFTSFPRVLALGLARRMRASIATDGARRWPSSVS